MAAGGDLLRQIDLLSFGEPGRSPPSRGYAEDHDDGPDVGGHVPGQRCSKCGKPLSGGGLLVLGYGLCCWNCYHKTSSRRDGKGDLSSDATAERNAGYNWRR